MKTWKNRFKEAREIHDLTQEEAAQIISKDLSVRSIQSWELGHRSPPAWVQQLILEKLKGQKK